MMKRAVLALLFIALPAWGQTVLTTTAVQTITGQKIFSGSNKLCVKDPSDTDVACLVAPALASSTITLTLPAATGTIATLADIAAGGYGDVSGPSSSVNNRVVFFDGTTGKLIKDSGLTLSGSNTGDQTITLTGDVTGSGTGSFAATLATVNSNVGTFGSATKASAVTVNGKGLVTAASESTVTPAVGSITGLGTGVATWLATPTGANLTTALSSGGGTTNYLRADGTFAAPTGSSTTPYWVTHHPLTPPASPNALDEEWNDGSGMSGTGNGLDASWTTFGASQTRAYNNAKLVLTGTASGGVSPNIAGMWKTAPGSTPYSVTTEVMIATFSNFNFCYVGLRRGSTGNMLLFGIYLDGSAVYFHSVQGYTAPTTRNRADVYGINMGAPSPRTIWVRVTNDGTNAKFYTSNSGVEGTFVLRYSETLSTQFSTNVPDEFMIAVDPFSTATPVCQFGPVRVQ